MKTITTLGLFLFLLSCNSATPEHNESLPSQSPISMEDGITDEFVNLVNDYRQKLGLRGLRIDTSMNEIALEHSENMASAKVSFGHDGFSFRCSQARTALGGGNLCLENVARGQNSVKEAFNSWINSSGHRDNIESARATHMGLGFTRSKSNVYYWTHLLLER